MCADIPGGHCLYCVDSKKTMCNNSDGVPRLKPSKKRQNTYQILEGSQFNFKKAKNVNILNTTDQEEQCQTCEIAKYRKLADFIQTKVYNSSHSAPSEACLSECKELIDYKLDKGNYDVRFAIYEGQADTLRTSKCIDKEFCNHPVYRCLKLLAPCTNFPGIAMAIYSFRYAGALAVCGRVQDARREAEKGMKKLSAFLNKTSMARINTSCLYGYVNVLLAGFCVRPDRQQQENILEWIEKGLEQGSAITESEASNMWIRMFLLKRAGCLLKISLSGEDICDPDKDHISPEDRGRARQSVEDAEELHWTNPDKRRQMLCKRIKAKLCFLDGDKMAAEEYLTAAINIATDFKREENSYKSVLQKWTS